MVEIGDAIKFAELAWVVLDYGWSPDLNATRQYHEFFSDVKSLAHSLERLTSVIEAARLSYRRLDPPPPNFGWDRQSLFEIVGDFNATLRECERLIETNKRYSRSSGPVRNVRWNTSVMPSVDRLRRRIIMHQSKLQHLFLPFEIDLKMRHHTDLVQRIDSMHEDVRDTQVNIRTIQRQMETVLHYFNIDTLPKADLGPQDVTANTLTVPNLVEERLESMFALHFDCCPDKGGTSALSDIADAFIRHLDSAYSLESTVSEDVVRAPTDSHWPRYVGSLQQELQNSCTTFFRVNGPDSIPNDIGALEIPEIWKDETLEPYIDVERVPAAIDHILELDLASGTSRRWRKINLFRHRDGADRRFRLDISGGNVGQAATEVRQVDLNLESASLIPRYANPDGKQPLEMTLRSQDDLFRLEFLSRPNLYLFQQALTGYEVADDYMSYNVKTTFSANSKDRKIEELAALQLWLPSRLEGVPASDDAGEEYFKQGDESPIARAGTSITTSTNHASSSSFNMTYGISRRPVAGTASIGRRASAPVNNPGSAQTRTIGDTNGTTAAGQSRTSLISPMANLFPSPRRSSTGPGSASRPDQSGQDPARASRTASLSSNSTSSTDNIQRLNGGRQSSAPSVNTMATSMSTATARTVSVSGHGNTASVGTLHCMPSEPMLVFFTQDIKTKAYGIVSLSLEQRVAANFGLCACTIRPDCRMTIIKANEGSDILPATRFGGMAGATKGWDILSLAESMKSQRSSMELSGVAGGGSRAWQRVFRVSMYFDSLADRKKFAGNPCTCARELQGPLEECLAKGHRGHFGAVRELYKRQLVDWHDQRYGKQVNMVDKPQWLGPGSDW